METSSVVLNHSPPRRLAPTKQSPFPVAQPLQPRLLLILEIRPNVLVGVWSSRSPVQSVGPLWLL